MLNQYLLKILMIIGLYRNTDSEIAVISPSNVADVCSGHQLELTCSVQGDFLMWNWDLFHEVTLQSFGPSDQRMVQQVNSVTVTTWRISASPLMSRLSINPVTNALNGTLISCVDLDSPDSPANTTIRVINGIVPQEVSVGLLRQQFGNESAVIVLELTPLQIGYLYKVSVVPQAEMRFNGSTRIQLTLSYNTPYNVSVVATHLCGQSEMSFIELNYTQCPYVVLNEIFGSIWPAIEGTNITFICPPGMVLIGTNSTTCMENGQWDPDPRDVKCQGLTMYTITDSQANTTTNSTDNNILLAGMISDTVKVIISCGVFGVMIFIFILVVILLVLLASKKKRKDSLCAPTHVEINLSNHGVDVEQFKDTDANGSDELQDSNAIKGLVYAEIGFKSTSQHHKSSKSIQAIDLDDSPVAYVQIQHRIGQESSYPTETQGEMEKNDCSLEVNLDNLLIQLRSQVTLKWYEFGKAVKIEEEVLDNFAQQCTNEDCIIEMFDYWLRHSEKKQTWKDVAKALKEIELTQLASEIENVYIIGKLPVQVDMDMLPQGQQTPHIMPELTFDDAPPIPPKTMAFTDDRYLLNNIELNVSASTLPMENVKGDFVPEIPPKPKSYESPRLPDIPPRPPKLGKKEVSST